MHQNLSPKSVDCQNSSFNWLKPLNLTLSLEIAFIFKKEWIKTWIANSETNSNSRNRFWCIVKIIKLVYCLAVVTTGKQDFPNEWTCFLWTWGMLPTVLHSSPNEINNTILKMLHVIMIMMMLEESFLFEIYIWEL